MEPSCRMPRERVLGGWPVVRNCSPPCKRSAELWGAVGSVCHGAERRTASLLPGACPSVLGGALMLYWAAGSAQR